MKHILCFLMTSCCLYSQQFRLEAISSNLSAAHSVGQHIVIAGTESVVMSSDDKGVSWRQSHAPYRGLPVDLNIRRNGEIIVIVTSSRETSVSVDAGRTWHIAFGAVDIDAVTTINDSIALGGGASGKLYRKNILANEHWELIKDINVQGKVLDLCNLGGDSALCVTNERIYILSKGGTAAQSVHSIIDNHFTGFVNVNRDDSGIWGVGIGNILYHSLDLQQWDSLVCPNNVSRTVLLGHGQAGAFVYTKRRNSSVASEYYIHMRYDLIAKKTLDTALFDSDFTNLGNTLSFISMPPIATSVLVEGNCCLVAGDDKLIYAFRNGEWEQICLLTDASYKLSLNTGIRENLYQISPYLGSRLLAWTRMPSPLVQSLDNGTTWRTPNRHTPLFQQNFNLTPVTFGANDKGTLILQSEFLETPFMRFSDTMQFLDYVLSPIPYAKLSSLGKSSVQSLGGDEWVASKMFIVDKYQSKSSVLSFSSDDGRSWSHQLFDSVIFNRPEILKDNHTLLIPAKYIDSVIHSDSGTVIVNKGCALYRSSDRMRTYETIPQEPHLKAIEDIKMFTANHGVGILRYLIGEKSPQTTLCVLAETFDGGHTWIKLDTMYNSDPLFLSQSPDKSMLAYSRSKPGPLYIWRNNGAERLVLSLPDEGRFDQGYFAYPLSKDTLMYSVPGRLYRIVLSPTVSVDEPSVDDFETPVYLQTPYPNPATGLVNIPYWRYAATVKPQDVQILCYSLNGTLIENIPVEPNYADDGFAVARWNAANIPPGAYLLKIETKQRKGNVKLFIKR